jgi:hypothetical protein
LYKLILGFIEFIKINKLIQSEMIVAKNSLLQLGIKKNETSYEYETMKNVLTKSVFPSLYKLLQIAISLPIASATCERSFSAMRKIKTWLRTCMLQDRFNNSAILCIEKDIKLILKMLLMHLYLKIDT